MLHLAGTSSSFHIHISDVFKFHYVTDPHRRSFPQRHTRRGAHEGNLPFFSPLLLKRLFSDTGFNHLPLSQIRLYDSIISKSHCSPATVIIFLRPKTISINTFLRAYRTDAVADL